jgi:predicted phosphodiesterase
MKVALLADIHGNRLALDAALADTEAIGVDQYWILGDLVALGPDPIGVLQRLSNLQNRHITRGNTDRCVVTGDRPTATARTSRAGRLANHREG